MKFFVKAAVVAAALCGSAVASADQFDFSYTFSDGEQVTGLFDGTAGRDAGNQLAVSNISNIQIALNGVAFSGGAGPLQINSFNTGTESFDAPSAATTIFANAAENNFDISNVDASLNLNPDYLFELFNDPNGFGTFATAVNTLHTDADGNMPAPGDDGTSRWSVAPVPVPAALPLLLSGLGLFGISRRRRAA
jgi:hypothetical protein